MKKEEFKELTKSESKHYEIGAERNAFLEGVLFALRQEYANQVKPEWVNVNDRLPDVFVPVTVYTKSGNTFTANLTSSYAWNMGHTELIPSSQVTHWMPLPQPPEK